MPTLDWRAERERCALIHRLNRRQPSGSLSVSCDHVADPMHVGRSSRPRGRHVPTWVFPARSRGPPCDHELQIGFYQ